MSYENKGNNLLLDLDKQKIKSQGITFTPFKIISYMYSLVNIKPNFKILEPSLGTGNFYIFLVKDLISKGFLNKKNIYDFISNLYGYEIESNFLEMFKNQLKDIVYDYFEIDITDILEKNFKNESFLTADINIKFDLIIGNPPYVRVHNISQDLKDILKNKFKDIYSGNADLSLYFIYKSIKLLNKNGISLFITSSKFKMAKYGEDFRRFSFPYLFCFIEDYDNPFLNVQIDTAIIGFTKDNSIEKIKGAFNNGEEWHFKEATRKEYSLKDMNIRISNGIVSGANKAHILTKEEYNSFLELDIRLKKFLKPILNGKDLSSGVRNYIIYATKDNYLEIEKEPILMNHFIKYKDILENRAWYKKQKNIPYFVLQSSSQFTNGKYNYLTPRIGELKFVKVPSDILYMDTCYNLIAPDDVNKENLIKFLSKEEVIKEFNLISNKIGSKIEIHANKFERISLNEEERKEILK